MNAHKKIAGLEVPGGDVDHVDILFNGGHPGVEKPRYHVVLRHIPKEDESRVAK